MEFVAYGIVGGFGMGSGVVMFIDCWQMKRSLYHPGIMFWIGAGCAVYAVLGVM